jgi:hypothetical protein
LWTKCQQRSLKSLSNGLGGHEQVQIVIRELREAIATVERRSVLVDGVHDKHFDSDPVGNF